MILDELLDDASADDHSVAARGAFLRRVATRIKWRNDPVIRLRYLAEADALIVNILPLPSAHERVVDGLLCIEFDGDDAQALPAALCLTGFHARPDTLAAKTAQHLLGKTLWDEALALAAPGSGSERSVRLDSAVRDARIRVWRRLTGLGVGIEIQPDELCAVLAGIDGEVAASLSRPLVEHDPAAVIAAIASLTTEFLQQQQAAIAGAPVVLGIQIGGPVDSREGRVHHYNKRGRVGEPGWGWEDVELAEAVHTATRWPTYVLNDAVAYATYERWIYPSPEESLRGVMLIAQGIGAKVIRNGELDLRRPMEIGNLVLQLDGEMCDCGKRGCVEATAGTLAILKRIQRVVGHDVEDMQQAVDLAETDGAGLNEDVIKIFREAGHDLGRVIGNVQATDNLSSWAIYGPEPMLTKGSEAGAAFLANLENFDHWVAYKPYQKCEIRRRPITGVEGAQGAAFAALEHFDLARPDSSATDLTESG